MATQIISITEFVLQVQKDLGLNTVLAGGAARDILYGKEPKDFDLFLLYNEGYQGEVLERVLAVADAGTVQEYPTYNEVSETIDFVIYFEVQGRPFDLIILEQDVFSPSDVIETFDLNLNQVWMNEAGLIEYKADHPFVTGDVSLTQSPDRPSKERVLALAEKFSQYDFKAVIFGLDLDYV